MKTLLRYYLINLTSLLITTKLIPGLTYSGGIQTLLFGSLVFAIINIILIPLLKILLLPLNLLTLGLFAWIANVLGLYALTTIVRGFYLTFYHFPGANLGGVIIPNLDLSPFWVAVIASFLIGIITHFLQWLSH